MNGLFIGYGLGMIAMALTVSAEGADRPISQTVPIVAFWPMSAYYIVLEATEQSE